MARLEGTGAQTLVECLHRAGVTTVFGVPGDTGVPFYDALYNAGDRLRHVLARDERSAAFMADAYARCANRVGVVEASSGGGTTFVVGGLGEPYAASVPLLVITSDIHRSSRGTGALTEIDQPQLFAAVTKWAATAGSAQEIPALVAAALEAATSGRPAPVSLVLPEDVLDEHASIILREEEVLNGQATALPRARPAAASDGVDAAVAALRGATWPAIVAGSGIHLSEAWSELERLADLGGIPVATSIHGKGSIAETGPWSLGVAGANGARTYANEYLALADVAVFIGTRANATDTNSYKSPPRSGPVVIGIDIEAERAGRNFPGSIRLTGDARTVLAQICRELPAADPVYRERRQSWIAERRAAWNGGAQPQAGRTAAIDPADVVRAIREIAGADAVIVADPGTPTPYVAAFWETASAARSVIVPRGHGPMGYAIPGAMGAALAAPGRPIVGISGDGSFAMSCGELETACRLALPIVYVQFTNGSLGWIKMLQHLYLERRYFGVDLGPTDAAAVARGFGLQAARIADLDEFRHAFSAFLADGRPAFIDITVPDQTQAVPPVAPWHAALAGLGERPVY
jgi:acetolactate synthase-1/2/3 large subunit